MLRKYLIVYVSSLPQSQSINWLTETCKELSKKHKTIYLDAGDIDNPQKFYNIFKSNFFSVIPFLFGQKFVHYQLSNLFPNKSFLISLNKKIINNQLNFIRQSHPRHKIIFVNNYPSIESKKIENIIRPNLKIADAHDGWTPDELKLSPNFDYVITNSVPLYEIHKNINPKTSLISAGYFRKQLIQKLGNQNFYDPHSKNIIFIANMTWKFDYNLLQNLINSLTGYKITFVCTELFDFLKNNKNKKEIKLTQKRKNQWEKIKSLKNVKIIPIINSDSLSKLKSVKFCVGINPLLSTHISNKYLHPVKFYEYFAMGLPVVSTPIDSLAPNLGPLLKFATSQQEWFDAINQFQSKKISLAERKKMLHIAASHTFETKSQAIDKIITSILNS